jgi:hypothetical protein
VSLPEEMVAAQMLLARCFSDLIQMYILGATRDIINFQAAYTAAVDQQQAAFSSDISSYIARKFFNDWINTTREQFRALLEGDHNAIDRN